MILTDREIKISLDQGLIGLDPSPAADAYSSTSVDLTLHQTLRQFRPANQAGLSIDPSQKGYDFSQVMNILTDPVPMSPSYPLERGTLILGWTNETLKLPIHSRVAARVEGKSSLARLGLGIHITAPTIHAGFNGPLQLEIVNHGPARIVLTPGMPICQIIFEITLGTAEKGYGGLFQHQQAN